MAKRWVGDPTTGYWVDENGNRVEGDAVAAEKTQRAADAAKAKAAADAAAADSRGRHPGGVGRAQYYQAHPEAPGNPLAGQQNPALNRGTYTGGGGDWATKAEGEVRDLGQKVSDLYGTAKDEALGAYGAFDEFGKNVAARNPTDSAKYYESQQGKAGPSQSRGVFGDTKDFFDANRNPVADAYNANKDYYSAPSHIDEAAGAMQTYGGNKSNTQNRLDQRNAHGSPTYDASRYQQRAAMDTPNYVQDRYSERQKDTAPEYASDLLGSLASTKSRAEGLMFDPEHTQAIGSLYDNVLMPQESGPGYVEQFYNQTADGENPYYDRLSDKTAQAAERRAAASGTFNAGRSQRMQGEAEADLRAAEFKDRGALAASADSAKDSRLAGLTSGAKTYEDSVLGNRKFNLDAATQMDTMATANNRLRGDLATSADNTRLTFNRDIDNLSGKSSEEWFKNQEDLDALAHNASGERHDQDLALDALSSSADTAEKNKFDTWKGYLGDQDATKAGKVAAGAAAAGAVEASDVKRREVLGNQGKDASAEEQSNLDYMAKLAKQSSDEKGAGLDRESSALLSGAAARAGITLSTALAQGAALTDAEMQAINIELQKAGMDAQESADLLHSFLGLINPANWFSPGGSSKEEKTKAPALW